MSPYKAIQVRLLRMSAERLSEKDKVHATISKDNPVINDFLQLKQMNIHKISGEQGMNTNMQVNTRGTKKLNNKF